MHSNDHVKLLTQEFDRKLAAGEYGDTVEVTGANLAYSLAYVSELEREVERLNETVREAKEAAWEQGMADAKLQALGIKPLVRNPYLEVTDA